MTEAYAGSAAASYSTGGGGVVLEHQYGACLQACLLTGNPVPELGDDATVTRIRFQASAVSAVDDLLISGRTPDGSGRHVSVGVRRAPRLVRSEEKSIPLIASYLKVVTGSWEEVVAGRWRLVLAVASPNTAVKQVGELAEIARATGGEAAFRAELEHGAHDQALRDRLGHLDALVAAALAAGADDGGVAAGELTWRFLFSLRVRELRLEGADTTDRTAAVASLRNVTADGTTAAADNLFGKLEQLADRYAPTGADVTEATLRRDLSGTPLGRSPSYRTAWAVLDRLTAQLADDTRFRLADASAEVRLDRQEARQALIADMQAAARATACLVVTGEPDVGKSALSLRAASELAEAGTPVTSLSLQDLPTAMLELETLLAASLTEVLGATALGDGRLLLVDGAEAALEGRGPLFTALAAAALRAGMGVVAVTRSDGASAARRALADAAEAAGLTAAVSLHQVHGLTRAEISEIAGAFPALARLASEPQASWLLGRPGLVDLLLRAGAAADLPAGPLSEADVFAAIWHQLVRHGEITELGGPTPDAREQAMVALARRRLLPQDPGEPPNATALPALRSDGLLRSAGPTSAWNPGEKFAGDLVTDLAVARLLITGGWHLLTQAGAPRWALRAARLACQARLASAGADSEQARQELQLAFNDLADQHGQRWAEVPTEALLTLGRTRQTLDRAWPDLLAGDRAGLQTVLRLALQRYVVDGAGYVTILEPLVALAYCGDDDLGQNNQYDYHGTGSQIRKLVTAWLRGLIAAGSGPDALRQRVRDRVLADGPEPHDKFAIGTLALLGPDLDDRAEAYLRAVPGGYLEPAVEAAGPIEALTAYQPALLLMLAETYYTINPGQGAGMLGFLGGIRSHRGNVGYLLAGWWYGPFFQLLCARPADALALINRLLDHAATIRAGGVPPPGPGTAGLDLDLPGAGLRRCAGDNETWRWYRGGGTAPPPCLSALLAVERWADHLLDALHIPIFDVIELLLRDCHNLAMPGLAVGLLVRHPEHAGTQLDAWLARPELWQMEAERALGEGPGTLHVQGPDQADLHGRDRRGLRFHDVAAGMTVRAMLDGDQNRLAALKAIGEQLTARARNLTAGDGDAAQQMAIAKGWAAILHPENHHLELAEDGSVSFQYRHPGDVAQNLAGRRESLERSMTALRLQSTYTRLPVADAPTNTLAADLAAARDLADNPPPAGPLHPADPLAAVAAAAVAARAQGRVVVPDDDLRWAADVLIEVVSHPWADGIGSERSRYPMGADRSAAAALPALLLPAFGAVAPDPGDLEEALRQSGANPADEVRLIFARATAPVWAASCSQDGTCRHQTLWSAVIGGLRDCQLGAWDQPGQRRLIEPLGEPFAETLTDVETEQLLVNRLTSPLIGAAEAARSDSCVAQQAQDILGPLLAAHRRGAAHWAEKNYGSPGGDQHGPAIARVLAELAAGGDTQHLAEHVRWYSRRSQHALAELLRNLAIEFTHHAALLQSLTGTWRAVMEAALDEIEASPELLGDWHWSGMALAGLIAAPETDLTDADPDGTTERAQENWPDPESFGDLIKRWLPIARGRPEAVDALIELARCGSAAWQASTGLEWVEELIGDGFAAVAGRCYYLIRWLASVRTALPGEAGAARWRRIVDGLAAAGDDRAVRLQQAEE